MPTGECVPYLESKCHPLLIPKHSIIGGICHIATLGIPYVLMDDSWPGFTNTDEECIACKGPPGANGCREIETIYRCAENVKVMHSSETEYQPEAIAISYF